MLVQVFFLLTFQDSCEGQLSQFLFFFCHFFFFLPFVGYTSPIDRHGWQMIWSLLTICTRNPVLLHRSDISISISVNMFQNSKIVKILKSTRDNFIVLQFHNVIRSQIFHTSQHHVTCFKPLLLRLNNFWPERGCYPYSQWVIFFYIEFLSHYPNYLRWKTENYCEQQWKWRTTRPRWILVQRINLDHIHWLCYKAAAR